LALHFKPLPYNLIPSTITGFPLGGIAPVLPLRLIELFYRANQRILKKPKPLRPDNNASSLSEQPLIAEKGAASAFCFYFWVIPPSLA
jgi:hypothetical protein